MGHDRGLVMAFIEKWRLDTDTFHLPFGEVIITLEDVHHILGLPTIDCPLILRDFTSSIDKKRDLVHEFLGLYLAANYDVTRSGLKIR